MSSFVEIGPPVLEKKIFEGFLPYMGMAAILVMCGHCVDISKAVSEKKIFENGGRRTDGRRRRRTDAGAWVYYKLTCEPSAQVS